MMSIWPFRPKKPSVKFQDDAFADLAEMFLHDEQDPAPGHDLLDASKFNYTLESLGAADQHLESMRARGLQGQDMMKLVLRCGAYVGEVIRQHSPGVEWHWVKYDQAVKLDARLGDLGEGLGTIAVLWDSGDGFCFPLAKVGKYLENGSEDSVKVFAQVIIEKTKETKPGS